MRIYLYILTRYITWGRDFIFFWKWGNGGLGVIFRGGLLFHLKKYTEKNWILLFFTKSNFTGEKNTFWRFIFVSYYWDTVKNYTITEKTTNLQEKWGKKLYISSYPIILQEKKYGIFPFIQCTENFIFYIFFEQCRDLPSFIHEIASKRYAHFIYKFCVILCIFPLKYE